jgi:IstB-like ATP binding protein
MGHPAPRGPPRRRLQHELTRLGRYPLIVIDEVGFTPFEAEAANLFFQLVSARYERASLIVTSHKPFGKAHMFERTCVRQGRNFTGSWSCAAFGSVGSC